MNEEKDIYKTPLPVKTVKVFGRVPSAVFLILKQSNHFGDGFDDWFTLCIVNQLQKEGLIEKPPKKPRKKKAVAEDEAI